MNLLVVILLILISSSCKAQTAPLYQMDPDLPAGTHFKDLDNDLPKFEGTWQWQRNDSIITIVLQKKEDVYDSDYDQYEDFIIGEYKFTVNGNVVQNYLPLLEDSSINIYDHYLSGNYIMHKNHLPICDECSMEERRIFLYFTDPLYEYINSAMILRHFIDINGTEKLHVIFYSYNHFVPPSIDSPMENRIPFGTYTFTKQ